MIPPEQEHRVPPSHPQAICSSAFDFFGISLPELRQLQISGLLPQLLGHCFACQESIPHLQAVKEIAL